MRPCLTFALLVACAGRGPSEPLAVPTARLELDGTGLAVRTHVVKGDRGDLQALLEQAGRVIDDGALSDRLASDGLHVRRIDSAQVDLLVASMDAHPVSQLAWHGQVLQWRDVVQRRLPGDGLLVSAAGTPHLIDRGLLTLLCRSWTMQREDGRFLYLHLRPTWHVEGLASTIPGQPIEPRALHVFEDLQIECLLGEGEALLCCAALSPPPRVHGPLDDGPPGVRMGEALLGAPSEEPLLIFVSFEAHGGAW